MFYKLAFYIVCVALSICLIYIFKKARTIRIIRVSRIRKTGKIPLGDLFGHIYGGLGLVGLSFTLIAFIPSYRKIVDENLKYVLLTLVLSLGFMVVAFIVIAAIYNLKLFHYRQSVMEARELNDKVKTQYIVNRYLSELFHSVTHYHRNINARLFQFLQNPKAYSVKDIEDIKQRFNDFLIILTSNIQSYFSFITNDNCSVTIKRISDDKKHVYSFFRDPTNFKIRKRTDEGLNDSLGQYSLKENTAFKIIVDPKYKNNFFYEDNLMERFKEGEYINSNPNWHKLYNATIVVPISIYLKEDVRNVIGFLTVDNRQGGLAVDTHKEFLFSIGDLLYNIFLKYTEFTSFVESKE